MIVKFSFIALLLCVWLQPVSSDAGSVQSARPIRANTVVSNDDLVLVDKSVAGAFQSVSDAVGLEAKKTLYPGRPVMIGDLGPVSVIDRNELVQLIFKQGTLRITAEGRALGRAAIGQRIKVMNSDSKMTVTGVVVAPTIVEVQN